MNQYATVEGVVAKVFTSKAGNTFLNIGLEPDRKGCQKAAAEPTNTASSIIGNCTGRQYFLGRTNYAKARQNVPNGKEMSLCADGRHGIFNENLIVTKVICYNGSCT